MAEKVEKAESAHHEKQLDSHAFSTNGTNGTDTGTPQKLKGEHPDLEGHASVDLDESGDESWRDNIDTKHEKRILRKLDIHLLPFVSLLYLLSFL